MVRWRALLLKSLCSQLFRSSSCINSQAKELVRLPLGPAGLYHGHREVCGIFEEPSDQAGAEAEKPSAASDGSGAASSLAAALSNLTLSGASKSRHFDQVLPVEAEPPLAAVSEPVLKDFGRPSLFHGLDDTWPEWSFVMRAWILANNIVTEDNLRRIETCSDTIDLDLDVPDHHVEAAKRLYLALALVTRGAAQNVVRAVETGNGFEAWRRMVRRYDRRDSQCVMGLLQTIVMRLGDKLNEFDILVTKYEQMTGERISDRIKVAVVSRVLIDPLKSQVLLTVPTLT